MLRSKLPARVRVTPQERSRLAKLAKPLGSAIKALIATTRTEHPAAEWVAKQAHVFRAATSRGKTACRVHIRDSDTKFGKAFDEALWEQGITPIALPHCAPNLNAHVERFIQTLQVECLDRFIVLWSSHLDHLTTEFIDHYNRERPHSSLEFATPAGRKPTTLAGPANTGEIRCKSRLGGVIKHY